jgi:hypothetical protein
VKEAVVSRSDAKAIRVVRIFRGKGVEFVFQFMLAHFERSWTVWTIIVPNCSPIISTVGLFVFEAKVAGVLLALALITCLTLEGRLIFRGREVRLTLNANETRSLS